MFVFKVLHAYTAIPPPIHELVTDREIYSERPRDTSRNRSKVVRRSGNTLHVYIYTHTHDMAKRKWTPDHHALMWVSPLNLYRITGSPFTILNRFRRKASRRKTRRAQSLDLNPTEHIWDGQNGRLRACWISLMSTAALKHRV